MTEKFLVTDYNRPLVRGVFQRVYKGTDTNTILHLFEEALKTKGWVLTLKTLRETAGTFWTAHDVRDLWEALQEDGFAIESKARCPECMGGPLLLAGAGMVCSACGYEDSGQGFRAS